MAKQKINGDQLDTRGGVWSSWTPTITANSGTFTTVSSPGTYSKITDVAFTSVFAASANTLKVVDMWVNGRFVPSNDFLVNGTDVAAVQRLTGKLSYSTRNVEVWGMFGSATSVNGVVGMLVVI